MFENIENDFGNEVLTRATTWMNLGNILLNERS